MKMWVVEFGGRKLPVWHYDDGLFYVTLNPQVIEDVLNNSYHEEIKTPTADEGWYSGQTGDLAVMAAIYATLMRVITAQKAAFQSQTDPRNLADAARSVLASMVNQSPYGP